MATFFPRMCVGITRLRLVSPKRGALQHIPKATHYVRRCGDYCVIPKRGALQHIPKATHYVRSYFYFRATIPQASLGSVVLK